VRPKRVILIGCDAEVREQDVHEARSLDELSDIRMKGLGGGGGTSFIPVFDWVREHEIKPEALIYITDLMGSFPSEAPAYPVVWCASTDIEVPWGDVVRIKV
jgi:predicted metal-dependent peptidase